MAKLTREQAEQIRRAVSETDETYASLAARYGVSQCTIGNVVHYVTHVSGTRDVDSSPKGIDRAEVERRRARGETWKEIARHYGVSQTTIYYHLSEERREKVKAVSKARIARRRKARRDVTASPERASRDARGGARRSR